MAPTVDGGDGDDAVVLDGDFGIFRPDLGLVIPKTFDFTHVERLIPDAGHDYFVVITDGNVESGHAFIVDTRGLDGGDLSIFSANNGANGVFMFFGGSASDLFVGSANGDTLAGGSGDDDLAGAGGSDTLAGGDGADIFDYGSGPSDSTGSTYDKILDFDADVNRINLHSSVTVTAYDGNFNGTVNSATFDADLAAAVAGHFSGSPSGAHALTILVVEGTLWGHTILVVDANGNGAYNSGTDYVMDVTLYRGTLDTGDFI